MADWHTRAIIYQIDSALFYDLNGDGCGDIAGIAAKLRYIRPAGRNGDLDNALLPYAVSG